MTSLILNQPAKLYEYSGQKLIAFTYFFIPFQIFFVVLRFYSRSLLGKIFTIDNGLVALSLFSQLVMAGLAIGSVLHAGVGHHITVLTTETQITWGKYLFAISTIYFAMTNVPKFAILHTYYQVFSRRHTRIATVTIGAILLAQSISTTIAALAACDPLAANYDLSLLVPPNTGHCIDKEKLFIWSSFPNIVTDVTLLLLPLPILVGLKMELRVKLGVIATFAVGSFGLITSCVRFAIFFGNNSFIDGTWTAVDLITWTEVEAGVYLISACLMSLKPLIDRFLGAKRSTSRNTSYGNSKSRQYIYRRNRLAFDDACPLDSQTTVEGTDTYLLQSRAESKFTTYAEGSCDISASPHQAHSVDGKGIMVTTQVSTA